MSNSLPSNDRAQFQVDRIAFFSDAVFAIAITLLALNIYSPSAAVALVGPSPSEDDLGRMVNAMLPRILGFALSFLVIGNYWRSHHRLFRWVRNHDHTSITINMLLLLAVSFIPAPTTFYSQFPDYRTPLIFYAVGLACVGLLNALLWRYLGTHPALLDPATPPQEMRLGARRSLIIPGVCALAVALVFVNPWLARLSLLSIPLWVRAYTWLAQPRGNSISRAAASGPR